MPTDARTLHRQVREAQDNDWLPKLVGAMDRVPARLRETAREMLGIDASGRELPEEAARPAYARAQALAGLAVEDRTALFEGMFPGKGRAIEGGWQSWRRLPYRAGYPWRSPTHEPPGLIRRYEWLVEITGCLAVFGNRPLTWLAAWHGHALGMVPVELGVLLAAGMDLGDAGADELWETVRAILEGRHEVGLPTGEIIQACLCTRRPEAAQVLERQLLAAGREEGYREKLLRRIHVAPVEAFQRFGRVVIEHRLLRFSSAVEAFNGWFGFPYDAAAGPRAEQVLGEALALLDDPARREAAARSPNAETVHLSLWAEAFLDIGRLSLDAFDRLLGHPEASHRLVAAEIGVSLDRAVIARRLVKRLADPDWRVAATVLQAFGGTVAEAVRNEGLAEALDGLLERLPKAPLRLEPLVWPWQSSPLDPDGVLSCWLANRGERSPADAMRHLDKLGIGGRHALATQLAGVVETDARARGALVELLADPSPEVRGATARGLKDAKTLEPELAPALEALLGRKAGDLREHALALLLKQPDAGVLASADRLLTARAAPNRTAGLELLRQLAEHGRSPADVRARGEAFAAKAGKLAAADQAHLVAIRSAGAPRWSAADGFGLAPADRLTPASAPRPRPGRFASETTGRLAEGIERLFQPHNLPKYRLRSPFDDTEFDGDLGTAFNYATVPDDPAQVASVEARLPLRKVWVDWLRTRGPELRDPDGYELLRLLARKFARWRGALVESAVPESERRQLEPFFGPGWAATDPQKRWGDSFFPWLPRLDPPSGDWPGFVLDGFESTLALLLDGPCEHVKTCMEGWLHVARLGRVVLPDAWQPGHHARLWRLLRWRDDLARAGGTRAKLGKTLDRPILRWPGNLDDLTAALASGGATEADACDLLLLRWQDLRDLSREDAARRLRQVPALRSALDRCRERLLEIELARGDTPTEATQACLALGRVEGVETFVRLLTALGDAPLDRQDDAGKDRVAVFSRLLKRCHPKPDETPERFADAPAGGRDARPGKADRRATGGGGEGMVVLRGHAFPVTRLVEAAMWAPQWARHVECATGWDGLAEGLAWVHAHTKVPEWDADDGTKQAWRAEMAMHSPVTSEELLDGAVDIEWFRRVHERLGPERWAVVHAAAKYASDGSGHARARTFADALTGASDEQTVVGLVAKKRQQDAVRALGLLPLPAKGRDAVVLRRYEVLQEFVRGSREFGAQRRASEKRAFEIGLGNLARTAGYASPIRLQWAMEARAVADLADGPITAMCQGVTMTLSVDAWGEVETTVTQGGKVLKDLPATAKKRPEFVALRERKAGLKRQAARIRASLETLMIQGETFTGGELRELLRHPLLGPMLTGLVLVGDGIAGYPILEGKALEGPGGKEPVRPGESLRVAHPHDLLPAAAWAAWQRECFARERIQPFKQVFREWYPVTDAERGEATQSRRYAGHQVWPRQAFALLGTRGWVPRSGEGLQRVIHAAGLVAWLDFEESWFTPAEIEGLTVGEVFFTRRGECERIPLESVPPRWFSETMRDLDLMVGKAHRGGADPEVTASSIAGRAALVRETAGWLGLKNVEIKDRVVEIAGELGRYSVHLGSAVTHRLPGGMVFLVPVPAQHRGRIFLPFADDDPKSAEILSKVLLLARDREIRDPAILAQIRA